MRKQVPFKAVIRQPVRTLIFVLLVGLASFGFISRAVEYAILSREMDRIEQFYRTTGTLVPLDATLGNNVYQASQIVSGSPYVLFEDRRTITQAVTDDILNAVHRHQTIGGNATTRGQQMYSYKGLDIFDTIAIIEADRVNMRQSTIPPPLGDGRMRLAMGLTFRVVEVVYGQPNAFNEVRQYLAMFEIDEDGNSIVDNVQQGGLYLVRIIQQSDHLTNTAADVFPLFDDVYFVDATDENALAAAFAAMQEDTIRMNENNHMLMLTGTKDMTTMPFVLSGVVERVQGRFIGYEDYENSNHVIVIPQRMEGIRANARIGDTITLTLRDMRTFVDGAPMPPYYHAINNIIPDGAYAHWRNMPAGYWVSIPQNYPGDWQSYPTIQIEVEIVGTYQVHDRWNLPRWAHIRNSFQHLESFVPASIIPDGFGIVDAHIVSGAYSFVLNSPGDDIPFMAAHAEELLALGFAVQFFGEDAANFLNSAVPIRNAIRINLILFVNVLALALVLTVFLYLRARYKEFAILRALGVPGGNAIWQVVVPVVVFWLPVVVAASIGAWFFAMQQAASNLELLAGFRLTDFTEPTVVRNILQQLRYEAEMTELFVVPQLSLLYLVWLCVGLAAVWVATVLVGAALFARKSMVSLLQGVNGAVRQIRDVGGVVPTNIKLTNIRDILLILPVCRTSAAIKSALRHHWRHIRRAPIKYALVVGLALFFILALGWLNRTITVTEQEIDRLYETTVITGEVIDPTAGVDAALWGHSISPGSIERLLASDFVDSVYLTSLQQTVLLVPLPEDAPEDKRETHRYDDFNFGKSISCWDTFYYQATRPAAFGIALSSDFEIEFMPGFDPQTFTEQSAGAHGFDILEELGIELTENLQLVVITRSVGTTWLQRHAIVETMPDGTVQTTFLEDIRPELPAIQIIVHESLLYSPFWADTSHAYVYFDGDFWPVSSNTMYYQLDENYNHVLHPMALGDYVYIGHGFNFMSGMGGLNIDLSNIRRAQIVGVYSGGHPGVTYRAGQGLIILGVNTAFNYSTATFTINQDKLRDLHGFTEYMNDILTYVISHSHTDPFTGLTQYWSESFLHNVVLNDTEFRAVIIPLEENLNLLRILYPVAIVLSFILALGLSLLLMLHNAKIVAILRVLGAPRHKTRFNLGAEQFVVCIAGVAIGLLGVLVMGVGFTTAMMLVGVYLAGAAIGTITGVLVISYKTPLELLQVRE